MNANALEMGPVDVVVIAYPPGTAQSGEAVPLFIDLADRGLIRVLDVLAVQKNADGTYAGVESVGGPDETGLPDLVPFAGARTGLIDDDDVREAAEALEPGEAAVLIVFENTWAAPFVTAVRRNGGRVVGFERVAAQDLLEALDRAERVGAPA
jgi:hypothetical protein